MAASCNWRRNLNDHSIFTKLRGNVEHFPNHIDSTNILCIKDGEIFIWDAYNSCILTTNIKFLVGKNESEIKTLAHQVLFKQEIITPFSPQKKACDLMLFRTYMRHYNSGELCIYFLGIVRVYPNY